MKKTILFAITALTGIASVNAAGKSSTEISVINQDNILTEQEQREGWKLLFNGENSEGWRGAKLDGFPAKGWVIENGFYSLG